MVRIPGIGDVVGPLKASAQALAALPGAVLGLAAVVDEARQTLAVVHRAAVRVDALVEELEEPLRALAPGLSRVATVLDDPVVDDLPATLRAVQDDLLPVLRTLADTHERVAYIAGSTDRIMAFVDETSRTLSGLPGAGLLGRRRASGPPGRIITVEQPDR